MKPRDELYKLIETGTEILRDPLANAKLPSDVVYYGVLKTDVFMAKEALSKNSVPMIQHYIDKLKLHMEGQNGQAQEENRGRDNSGDESNCTEEG